MKSVVFAVILYTAIFITGFVAGMCVKVLVARDVPVIHGGGELLLLTVIPSAMYMGYRLGSRNK